MHILGERGFLDLGEALLKNPRAGSVERGLGGTRKIRVRRPGHGKSRGARVLYFFQEHRSRIYLLLAYSKSNQPVLTGKQRRTVCELIAELEGG